MGFICTLFSFYPKHKISTSSMKRISFLILVLIGLSGTSYGQWKQLFQFSSGVRTIYFLDQVGHPEIGFSGLQDGELWRTTDRGLTWAQIIISSNSQSIADITFKSELIGWLVTKDIYNGGAISRVFKTNDGGLNWTLLKSDGAFSAVYYHPPNGHLFLSDWENGCFSSIDDGDSWIQITNQKGNGYAFDDLNHGIMTFPLLDSTSLLHTSDGGSNWQLQTIISSGAWQPAAKPGTTTFFMFSEYTHSLFRSDDEGMTWNTISTLNVPGTGYHGFEFSGCLRINACNHFFAQSTSVGFFSSSNEGVQWLGIGGPSNDADTRFCINGPDIFASDLFGSLWVFRDSSVNTSFHFSSSRIINDSLNIVIHLPIFLSHSGTMEDVDMIMHYPTQSLKLISTNLYNGKSFDVPGSEWAGRSQLHFSAADLNTAPDTLLGYVNFLWTPYEYACDNILFDSLNIQHPTSDCSSVSTNILSFQGIIGSYPSCSISLVTDYHYLRDTLLVSIHPNPANNEIVVETDSPLEQEVDVSIYNELGQKYIETKQTLVGKTRFNLSIVSLPSGIYHLILKSTSGSVTSDFVKLR
jgi:photosystem II stability/assembly factor-like uncharacterized protein